MAKKEYIYATGKRKSSIARVNIIPGTGKITINKKDLNEIYTLDTLKAIVLKPFTVANMMEKYDVEATVHGGGFVGQAGAVSHGIAKALATTDPEVRLTLTVLKKQEKLHNSQRDRKQFIQIIHTQSFILCVFLCKKEPVEKSTGLIFYYYLKNGGISNLLSVELNPLLNPLENPVF